MRQIFLALAIPIAMLSVAAPIGAEDHPTYGLELEGFDYPHDVNRYRFKSQGSDVAMAYMDVNSSNGKWPDRGPAARKEFLRRDLGKDDHGAEQCRLPCRCARSDRILQIDEAARLSV